MSKADKLHAEWETKYAIYDRHRKFGFRRRVLNYAKRISASDDQAHILRELARALGISLTFKDQLETTAEETPDLDKVLMAPVWKLQLIRDPNSPASSRTQITSPRDATGILADYLKNLDREHFVVMMLDTKNRVIGLNTVAVGGINSAYVSPRETFKPALLSNATAVIVAHNHPSGDPTPSPEDAKATANLIEAGKILDIEVLDHIVIGEAGRFASLKELGLM